MAPSYSRQFLIWTLPTVAVILSYLWYKRKRIGDKTDPGETSKVATENPKLSKSKSVSQPNTPVKPGPSSARTFSRSLSGVDSAPIDIVIPPKLKATKSNPVVISDEDLDFEIEKIKSMRHGGSIEFKKFDNGAKPKSPKSVSPPLQAFTPTAENNSKQPEEVNKRSLKMAQKVSEQKLAVPKDSSSKESTSKKSVDQSPGREHEDLQRQNSGRDSANHSPADVMLASPSLSSISDNHSEGSNDSGKGGSDVVTPPPSRTPGPNGSVVGDGNYLKVYEFIIPQTLVGKLIGKHGAFVSLIKDRTGAHVIVRKHPTSNKLKVCVVEGSKKEIDSALKMIREKFPPKRFSEVTLEQVSFLPQVSAIPLVPDHLYLKLIEGINNDTIVSCMVSPNHLFLQQPTHPTFPNLNILNNYMNVCYAESNSPLLPSPVPDNTVCAAYSVDSWYRAIVLSTDAESGTCYVKFLDFGGYAYIEKSKLRQIRGDFMLLPFQAAECFLANIKPTGDAGWSEAAYTAIAELTKGAILYTQVADYTQEGVPIVFCYLVTGPQQILFLNEELVTQGCAEWLSNVDEASGVSLT